MLCSIDGCERLYNARGFCQKHYDAYCRAGKTERRQIGDLAAARRQAIRLYKLNARRRSNKEISLVEEEWIRLFESNCYYCGSPPSNKLTIYGYRDNGGFSYKYSGVDRLDNSQGYHMFNVVPCCSICNTMKLDLSTVDFLEHVKKIFRRISNE